MQQRLLRIVSDALSFLQRSSQLIGNHVLLQESVLEFVHDAQTLQISILLTSPATAGDCGSHAVEGKLFRVKVAAGTPAAF